MGELVPPCTVLAWSTDLFGLKMFMLLFFVGSGDLAMVPESLTPVRKVPKSSLPTFMVDLRVPGVLAPRGDY